jgi:hypothetical protein
MSCDLWDVSGDKLRQVRYFETSGSDNVLTQRRDFSCAAEKTSKLVHKVNLSLAAAAAAAVWQHCAVFLLQVLA